ncbi:unnamed protein product [Closterium sp. Yama58-4]|nr:unnamed protein product [Closterium sp. Yama58-4]
MLKSLLRILKSDFNPAGPQVRTPSHTFLSQLDNGFPPFLSRRTRHQAPFHEYLKNPNRVFDAFFPDKQRSEKLSEDEWRIHMLPITFFLVTARPIVDMRIFLDQPSPLLDRVRDASSVKHVMRLQATNWELKGVDYDPANFSLDMAVTVGMQVPPNLFLVPRQSIEAVGSAVLQQLLASMKDKVNNRVLSDYAKFSAERARSAASSRRLPNSNA